MNTDSKAAEAARDREEPYDEPPTYVESTSSRQILTPSSSAFPEAPFGPSPPSDAQRAEAPVRVQRSNESIHGNYLIVSAGSAKTPPDVLLKTSNGRIATALWVEGSLPRACFIEAHTTNATIDLSVQMLKPEQPVHITATSSNGKIRMALPAEFQGMLTVFTTHSKHILSPELKACSVLVSLDDPPIPGGTTYKIGGPDGKCEAILKTSNAQIRVGFTTDAPTEEGGCRVM
ncbi:hypothetical protein MMC11_008001 [Xylographa trunciseda]|nr:hypothetical protein [Xylographa trunciseda]